MRIERLFLGIPVADGMLHDIFFESLLRTLKPLCERPRGKVTLDVRTCDIGWTACARNELIHHARASGASHILQIDSDHGWEDPEVVLSLLAHAEMGCDAVGCFYPSGFADDPLTEHVHSVLGGEAGGPGAKYPRARVDWLPTGFLLTSLALYDRIEAACGGAHGPLEYLHKEKDGTQHERRFSFYQYAISGQKELMGEDVWFSRVLGQMGEPMYKLVGAKIRHKKRVVYG